METYPPIHGRSIGKLRLSITVAACLMLLAPTSPEASTLFTYTGNSLSNGSVMTASVILPCDSCPPGTYGGLSTTIPFFSMSYGSVTLSRGENGSPTDPWITLDTNGNVVEWHLLISNDAPLPPYDNFILQTVNTTDRRYQHLSTFDGDITGGIYDAVLFRQVNPGLRILTSRVGSPGTWVATPVLDPTCVAKVTPADCGITFTSGNNTFAIAVNRDHVCLTLNGSDSIDPEGDPLQINWFIDQTNFVASTIVTNCFDLGCHTIIMMASDGRTGCDQFLNLCVITPAQAVQQCLDLVEQTQLLRKNKRPLIATLQAAQAAFDRDGWEVGAQLLKVFQQKVRTQVTRSNPNEAAVFIECAENILQAIECVASKIPRNDDRGNQHNFRPLRVNSRPNIVAPVGRGRR